MNSLCHAFLLFACDDDWTLDCVRGKWKKTYFFYFETHENTFRLLVIAARRLTRNRILNNKLPEEFRTIGVGATRWTTNASQPTRTRTRRRRWSSGRWRAHIQNSPHNIFRIVSRNIFFRSCFCCFPFRTLWNALPTSRFGCQLASVSRDTMSDWGWISFHFYLLIFFLSFFIFFLSLNSKWFPQIYRLYVRMLDSSRFKRWWKKSIENLKTQFSTINFNKISLCTPQKLHFAHETFRLRWQRADCRVVIGKEGEVGRIIEEKNPVKWWKIPLKFYLCRTNFLVNTTVEREVLKIWEIFAEFSNFSLFSMYK